MVPELVVINQLRQWLLTRLELARNEDGYSTEAVVVTALLVVMAIAAVAIISVKVLDKANNLQTG